MKPIILLTVLVFLLSATAATAQPFPLPDSPPGSSTTTYDAQGQFTTFRTPNGWTTYTPQGERYDSFPTHTSGTVTYGPQSSKWETIPGPASAFPVKPTDR